MEKLNPKHRLWKVSFLKLYEGSPLLLNFEASSKTELCPPAEYLLQEHAGHSGLSQNASYALLDDELVSCSYCC
jgi:hypothetical protein